MKLHEKIAAIRTALLVNGWAQGRFVNNAGNVCLAGAIKIAASGVDRVNSKDEFMEAYLGEANWSPWVVEQFIMDNFPEVNGDCRSWNDVPGRTFNHIIDLLDRAELLAKERDI